MKISLLPNLQEVETSANTLQRACHGRAVAAGWWNDLRTGEAIEKPVSELLMQIVGEIAEGWEGFRKGLMDDKLPHRKMLEVELADTVIRIFDAAGGLGFNLGGAISEKMEFNERREDHKREHRLAEGGKKI